MSAAVLVQMRAYTALLLLVLVLSAEAQVLKPEIMSNRDSMGERKAIAVIALKAIAFQMSSWAPFVLHSRAQTAATPQFEPGPVWTLQLTQLWCLFTGIVENSRLAAAATAPAADSYASDVGLQASLLASAALLGACWAHSQQQLCRLHRDPRALGQLQLLGQLQS
jgi:hypothetical protein